MSTRRSNKAGDDWLVGVRPVSAALRNDPDNVLEVFVDPDLRGSGVRECLTLAREVGVAIHDRSRKALNKQFAGLRHQGIAAHYRPTKLLNENDLADLAAAAGAQALFLVLDGVQDPRNLGACLRCAEAAAVTAVMIPRDRAVGVTATVRKASAGAADRVPIVQVTNLVRGLCVLKEAGVWVAGAVAPTQEAGGENVWAADLKGPLALVLGSEDKGLRRLTRETCDRLVAIPMPGSIASLNVSVVAGILLFEVRRQRVVCDSGAP